MPVGCLKAASPPPPNRSKESPGIHLKGLSKKITRVQRPTLGFQELQAETREPEVAVNVECAVSLPFELRGISREGNDDGQPMWWFTRTNTAILWAQGIFIILFTAFCRYAPLADGSHPKNNHHDILGGFMPKENPIHNHYHSVMNVHMLVLAGVGLRLAFIRDFSYSSIGVSLLIGGIGIQWAILCHGYISTTDNNIYIDLHSLIQAQVSSIAVSISHGAVLGLTSPLQALVLTLLHVPMYVLCTLLPSRIFKTIDRGASVSVHLFSAVYGVSVSTALGVKDNTTRNKNASSQFTSTKTSQLVAYLGSVYLVVLLPSVLSSRLIGDDSHRATINVILATLAASVVAFPASSISHSRRKFSISDLQCGLVGGFVSVAGVAELMVEPYGALLLGAVGSALSIFSRHFVRPLLKSRVGINDVSCVGVSHGLGGLVSGLAGVVMAALASANGLYGFSVYELYPAMSPQEDTDDNVEVTSYFPVEAGEGRTPLSQASYQLLNLLATIGVATGGGIITGLLLRLPFLENLTQDDLYSDGRFWQCPVRPPPPHHARHRIQRHGHIHPHLPTFATMPYIHGRGLESANFS